MAPENISRRSFLAAAGCASALSVVGVGLPGQQAAALADDASPAAPGGAHTLPVEATVDPKTGEVEVNDEVIVRNSACLGCYSSCGNRVRLTKDGSRILTTGGNPYHPSCAYPYLDFDAPLEEEYRSLSFANGKGNMLRGSVCGRGNASLDGYTQPDRITTPLKRAGARGEGKWKPIGWNALIDEVTEGGRLFADIGEDREIEGFKALHDTETPLNPREPSLGPVSNQLVALGGRSDGRTNISSRFTNCFGTLNFYYHSSSCGGTAAASSLCESFMGWTAPDLDDCEYVIFSGYFPGGNGFNFQGIGKRVAERLKRGECSADVLDPALLNGCITPTMDGINWVPLKTASTSSVILGMIRWMFENDALDPDYLSIPNWDAAYAKGFGCYTNAGFLVIDDENHPGYGTLLRAGDAGLEDPPGAADATAAATEEGLPAPEYYAVVDAATGEPAVNTLCPSAKTDFEGTVNGIKVRSSLLFLKDSAFEHTMDEYEQITSVPVSEIERMAREFTSHGTKVAMYGNGSTVMSNGVDTAFGMRMINALVGSHQMIGGCNAIGGSFTADYDGERYLLGTVEGLPDVTAENATPICRTGKAFDATDEYANRVAAGEKDPQPKLPWFQASNRSDNQALISILHAYPYQAKILVSWMANTLQATPGAFRDELRDRLKDPDIVPLHIACDVVVGEHAHLADYIVPDTNPFESFGCTGDPGIWSGFGTTVRWRVKTPESLRLDDGRYASYEAFVVDVAKACGMPGFGEGAIVSADGTALPFNDAPDYFLKAVANIAYDQEPVANIDEAEIKMQRLDELPEEWKKAVTAEEWPKVLKVLSRGGRYLPLEAMRGEDGRSVSTMEMQSYVYSEPRYLSTNFYTGAHASPVVRTTPQTFVDGTPYSDHYPEEEYPFKLTNYKPRFRSVSMLANSPIMQDICDHNFLEINLEDARSLGIEDGDRIRISAPTGTPMTGEAMVRAGVARGTFALAFGYGHRAYGAQDVEIEGVGKRPGNPRCGSGVAVEVMDDIVVKEASFPVADLEWSSPGRNGGMYKIEKM